MYEVSLMRKTICRHKHQNYDNWFLQAKNKIKIVKILNPFSSQHPFPPPTVLINNG